MTFGTQAPGVPLFTVHDMGVKLAYVPRMPGPGEWTVRLIESRPVVVFGGAPAGHLSAKFDTTFAGVIDVPLPQLKLHDGLWISAPPGIPAPQSAAA